MLCNQYGLDQSECGQEIAAAMEWYEKGIITDKDTGGIKLKWGNYEAIIEMIHQIGKRIGFGDLLAEGGIEAARKLGSEAMKCISYSKGALRTTGDLRHMTAYMLGEATSTRGSDHLRGSRSTFGEPGQYDGVAKAVYENQCICTLSDSLELCKFHTVYLQMEIGLKEMVGLFSSATGVKIDEEEIKKAADRIWNLERAFIVREGITKEDDYLMGRYLNEPICGGPLNGLSVDKEKWDRMLGEYYDLNGWDKKTGIPTRARLEALGLKEVADELEQMGKLPNSCQKIEEKGNASLKRE
jgi:aldehyde:ferredoxin oxidoreductase